MLLEALTKLLKQAMMISGCLHKVFISRVSASRGFLDVGMFTTATNSLFLYLSHTALFHVCTQTHILPPNVLCGGLLTFGAVIPSTTLLACRF